MLQVALDGALVAAPNLRIDVAAQLFTWNLLPSKAGFIEARNVLWQRAVWRFRSNLLLPQEKSDVVETKNMPVHPPTLPTFLPALKFVHVPTSVAT